MWNNELKAAIEAGLKAKEKIMEIYNTLFDVEIKDDNSPVTLADKTADKMIREHLSKLFPDYAFLTEESEDDIRRLDNDHVWIVDPVDGTKDFVARDNEFTTNIALSYKNEIVVGIVIIPASDEYYYAIKGEGAFKVKGDIVTRIHVNDKVNDLTVLTSRFHVCQNELDMIEKHSDRIKNVKCFGSSIKACKIASGLAEISYRLSSGTKEWDTAAIQIIVEEAGGVFVKPNGERMFYNRKDVYNREGYIITNRKENILL
ncbi:MAG: 3'(2'),5'-bisphosphate nucleotidase CysQ [Erysipelotrichales bacterium]|nr:3'(2'),5'-bisphosphate nucleotidase CysQ [Erysipelotrichales bacterium]